MFFSLVGGVLCAWTLPGSAWISPGSAPGSVAWIWHLGIWLPLPGTLPGSAPGTCCAWIGSRQAIVCAWILGTGRLDCCPNWRLGWLPGFGAWLYGCLERCLDLPGSARIAWGDYIRGVRQLVRVGLVLLCLVFWFFYVGSKFLKVSFGNNGLGVAN